MVELLPKPSESEVLAAVRCAFPQLAATEASFLAEGWDFWAYAANDYIFRIPKHDYALRSQAKERRLMPSIAPLLPLAVPDMGLSCDSGPNGHPFVGYRRVPGVPLSELPAFRSPALGRPLGLFLKALHSIPVPDPVALGLDSPEIKTYGAAQGWGHHLGLLYERVVRHVFPLISCEARNMARETFEAFLQDASNFEFEPCIVHGDLAREHVLVDPGRGALTGIIDFGDATLADPAHDFTSILEGGLAGILGREGIKAALDAYGPEARGFGFGRRAGFYRFLVPFHEVLGGIELGDDDILASGLRSVAELASGE